MKTPMQEVYENFNLMSDRDFKAWLLNTDLLEKEKEVMCEFTEYWSNSMQTIEEAYNKTFKTKER
jgi:hypothetical protein